MKKTNPQERPEGARKDQPDQDRPPPLAVFLLSKALPPEERENVLGDLEEAWCDVPTFGVAILLLAASATMASLVPALRATRLDPVTVLAEN